MFATRIYDTKARTFEELCEHQAQWFEGKAPHSVYDIHDSVAVGPREVFVTEAEAANFSKFAELHRLGVLTLWGQIGKCGDVVGEREFSYYAGGDLWTVAPHGYFGAEAEKASGESEDDYVARMVRLEQKKVREDVAGIKTYEKYYLFAYAKRDLVRATAATWDGDFWEEFSSRRLVPRKLASGEPHPDQFPSTIMLFSMRDGATLAGIGHQNRIPNAIPRFAKGAQRSLMQQFARDVSIVHCRARAFCQNGIDELLATVRGAATAIGR